MNWSDSSRSSSRRREMSQPGSATAAAAAVQATRLLGGGYGHPEGGSTAAAPPPCYAVGCDGYSNPEGASGDAADPEGGGNEAAAAAEAGAEEYSTAGACTERVGKGLAALQVTDEGGLATAPAATVAAATAYSPADYLAQLEAHLAGLQQQRRDLQQQLAATAAGSYQTMSQRLGTNSTGVPLPAELATLVEELVVLQSARQYLQYVQELQALIRHVEKAGRTLQQQLQQEEDGTVAGDAFLQDLSQAVDTFSSVMGYAIAVKQLADQGSVPTERLQQYAAGLLSRVDNVQQSLRALVSAAVQRRLAAVHWPPPLTVSGEGAVAVGDGCTWQGFAGGAGGKAAAAALQYLLVVLTTLQRASQHEQFSSPTEASQEGPLLWAAEELAAPLAQRLRHHFASGLPTDRPDRPEWLFATALKAAQQCSPLVQELQPCIEAHSLQAWYSMPLELARAVEVVGVNAIVREHLLPKLVEAGESALWLHLADEAMQFGRRFASLRGAGLALPDDEEFLSAAHAGSTIELLFQRPEWQEGWLGAEVWDASRQLDAACDAYSAWQPAVEQLLAVAGQEEDLMPDTPKSRGGVAAWHREFQPPACAEQVAALVRGLVLRGGWVRGHEHKLQYMQAVPLAVLRIFRDRLSDLLQQAEQFRGMLGDTWLPRVGAAVNAAHYIEHQLREPQGVLLLVELQDSAVAALEMVAAAPSAADGKAAGGGGRTLTVLLEREAAMFATLHKQWAYKLAKQTVDRFTQLLVPYKRGIAAFTAGYEEGVCPEQAAAAVAAAGPVAPSPAMLQAADSLQQLLRALAQQLDAVVFRDVWRTVALAVNYGFYNEVATEALFSVQGAAQLHTDLAIMAAVFGEYTGRPAAHFKESNEAVQLLTMPHAAAAQLLAALETQPRAAMQLLASHGVKALNAEQVAVVLLQRLDVLTSRTSGRGYAAAAAGGASV